MDILDEEFQTQYPLFRGLDKFFQTHGQPFSEWTTQLRKIENKADTSTLTMDQLCIHHYVPVVRDNDLRRKLLAAANNPRTSITLYQPTNQPNGSREFSSSLLTLLLYPTIPEKKEARIGKDNITRADLQVRLFRRCDSNQGNVQGSVHPAMHAASQVTWHQSASMRTRTSKTRNPLHMHKEVSVITKQAIQDGI